jgi:hypothetical protein
MCSKNLEGDTDYIFEEGNLDYTRDVEIFRKPSQVSLTEIQTEYFPNTRLKHDY